MGKFNFIKTDIPEVQIIEPGPAAAALPCGTGLAGLSGLVRFSGHDAGLQNGVYPAILSLWVTFF